MSRCSSPKIIVLALSVILIIWGMYIYFVPFSPENIARNSDGCLRFFGLPNMHYICADEMYSQGKDCLTFGYAYYCLKGFDSNSLERLKTELRYKGANFTDSIATFRLKRDNIDGTLRLLLYDNAYQVIVSFEETED